MEFAAPRFAPAASPAASKLLMILALLGAALLANSWMGTALTAQAPSTQAPSAGLRTNAEPVARYGDANIAVQLLADGAPRPGEEWMLALRFTPSGEEWHGYWSNPGDAGQGMQLQLDLPEGWVMGEPRYPVPTRLVQELGSTRLMNHIYKGSYAVLVPVEVPEDAVIEALPEVTGFVDYLSCTDILCVPQDAVLRAGQASLASDDFARWRTEAAPMLDSAGRFDLAGEMLRLAIPLPASVDLPDPFGPMIAWTLPASTSRSTPLRIALPSSSSSRSAKTSAS